MNTTYLPRHLRSSLQAHLRQFPVVLVLGARQVGKTWLMREFGRTHYEQVAYINFDSNARMQRLFEGDFKIERLISGLSIEAREKSLDFAVHNAVRVIQGKDPESVVLPV